MIFGNHFLTPMTPTERIQKKCDSLSQYLGSVCLPFSSDEKSAISNPEFEQLFGDDIHSLEQLCLETAKTGLPAALSISNRESVFAIPIEVGPPAWFAVGMNPFPATDSAIRLVKLAFQSLQQELDIEERDHSLSLTESELNRCYEERAWIRELNSSRASRKRSSSSQSKQIIESVRRLIDAEAVGIFLFDDQDAKCSGLESMITSHPTWTSDDIRYLIQRLPKPELGDIQFESQLSIKVRRGVLNSAVIVPIGDTSVLGYVVACNRKHGAPIANETGRAFDTSDAQTLLEVADFLVAEGFTNTILKESEELVLGTLRAMSIAIEARDPYTRGHSERVAEVGFEIAQRMNLSEESCQEIYLAGVLHDVGKIGIPDHVLLKPGKLDSEEFAIIQKHPEIGFKIIDELGKLKFVLPGVLYHHERFDGMGYPHKLKGEEIPLMARVLAVSDAFDAMTSSRIYRTAMSPSRAAEILRDGAGIQWDARVVEACLEWIDEKVLVLANGMTENRNYANPGRLLSQALRTVQF
jgi:HD-GYP domain-containing protein (c-di-GMP phosphodiesterase class II)